MSTRGTTEQENFDDSGSGIGSEMSYSENSKSVIQNVPQVMQNLPLPMSAMHLAPGSISHDRIGISDITGIKPEQLGHIAIQDAMARARPGKRPAKADEELSPEELRRRNKRRLRNREAAQRCRQRRLGQIEMLQNEVEKLKESKQNLATENDKLKDELNKLKFQLSVAQTPAAGPSVTLPGSSLQSVVRPVVNPPEADQMKIEPSTSDQTTNNSRPESESQSGSRRSQPISQSMTIPTGTLPTQPITIPTSLPIHQHHLNTSQTLLPMLSPILVPFNSFYSIGGQTIGGQGVLTPNTPLTSAAGVRFSFPRVSPEALEAARKSSVSALAELSNTMAVL